MIDIKVKFSADDLRAMKEAVGEERSDELQRLFVEAIYDHWVELANSTLTTSRAAYISGLFIRETGRSVKIELVGAFPNIIERGSRGFDMRKTLLRPGENSRVIAVSHASPSAQGLRGATPIGRAYKNEYTSDKAAKAYANRVYKAAKQLGEGEKLPARVGGGFPLKDHHKSDLYAGMVRQQLGSKISYTTFRTITAEPGDSWHYPRTEGKHLAEQVRDDIPNIASSIFRSVIRGMGGGK